MDFSYLIMNEEHYFHFIKDIYNQKGGFGNGCQCVTGWDLGVSTKPISSNSFIKYEENTFTPLKTI